MPNIDKVCKFTISPAHVVFHARNNGSELGVSSITITQSDAATLAWLLNGNDDLEIRIKKVSEE